MWRGTLCASSILSLTYLISHHLISPDRRFGGFFLLFFLNLPLNPKRCLLFSVYWTFWIRVKDVNSENDGRGVLGAAHGRPVHVVNFEPPAELVRVFSPPGFSPARSLSCVRRPIRGQQLQPGHRNLRVVTSRSVRSLKCESTLDLVCRKNTWMYSM